MGGRLEHEIRLLPQVLSCSVLKDDYVVVLIDPSADPATIQLAVERILQRAGSEATVRVIGPPEAAATAATRTLSPLVATAAVATVAAIGVGALVGGLVAVDHPKSGPAKPAPAGAGPRTPLDSVDALRGLPNTVRTFGTPPARLPVEAPDHTLRVLPISFGKAAEAVSLSAAMPPVRHVHVLSASDTDDHVSIVRRKQRGKKGHHLGKGPPPWAHSAQRPPHPHEGRAH